MKQESREIWAKRVERWKDSGLSCREFCAETGLNYHTLSYWKSRLARKPEVDDRRVVRRRQSTPSFVEVKPQPAAAYDDRVEVVVRNVTLRVSSNASGDTLRRLVDVIKGLG